MPKPNIPLFNFAWHPKGWLEEVAKIAKPEPWGARNKILELYLKANFEIAKSQAKVYEDRQGNIAFWRAGSLVNMTSDPIWLVYKKKHRQDQFPEQLWEFDKVMAGDTPKGLQRSDFEMKYTPPEFNRDWLIHFEQTGVRHIMSDTRNQKRLQDVFSQVLGGTFNDHLIFRAIYGEIQLKRKEEVVLPQWYHGDYKFLMPLFLTQADHVELTAALEPDPPMKRYIVKTLLLPYYSYAYARALVKSRASFADWMMLPEAELNAVIDEDTDTE
jgi:hypothetical protein